MAPRRERGLTQAVGSYAPGTSQRGEGYITFDKIGQCRSHRVYQATASRFGQSAVSFRNHGVRSEAAPNRATSRTTGSSACSVPVMCLEACYSAVLCHQPAMGTLVGTAG